jgi:probable rRNA maturation factor
LNRVEISIAGVELPLWIENLQNYTLKVLDFIELDRWEVSILLCSDEIITDLNNRYRNKNKPTDVLSFPQAGAEIDYSLEEERDNYFIAGDIVISMETMKNNAAQLDVSQNEEMQRLVVHGLLHLAGLDHEDEDSAEMLEFQDTILNSFMEEEIF